MFLMIILFFYAFDFDWPNLCVARAYVNIFQTDMNWMTICDLFASEFERKFRNDYFSFSDGNRIRPY